MFTDSITAVTPLFCKPETWTTISETSGEITRTELRRNCGAVVHFSLKSNLTVGLGFNSKFTSKLKTKRTHPDHGTDGKVLPC